MAISLSNDQVRLLRLRAQQKDFWIALASG
jgi:hypothetical protein